MSSFIVETHLNVCAFQFHKLEKAFKYAHIIYTRLVSYEKKKLEHFDLLDDVKSIRDKLRHNNQNAKLKKALSYYRKQCQLTKFDIIKDVNLFYKDYKEYITSQMAQSIAKRVNEAITKYIENVDVELHTTRLTTSIESESTTNGIKFDGHNVIYANMILPIKVRKDSYFNDALDKCELKYIRIVKRTGKTKTYYVAQFVFKGEAITSRRIELGKGDVGIDIGTSTIAYCSKDKIKIEELSKEIERTNNKISTINQKMDNSRKANNKDNFNDDGTIKKKEERKPWHNSKNYKRLRRKRKYLLSKFANQRKNLYEIQVNELLTNGDRFIVEQMDFKSLQKRKKETLKDEKGRFLKKARYGKSIGLHAPSLFLNILNRKLSYLGKSLLKVNTRTFKASQYDHIKNEYIKCDLDTRIKDIGGHKVQRDLYSAFLLMNAKEDLQETDIKKCNDNFERFLSLHEIEIKRLTKQENISCIGI